MGTKIPTRTMSYATHVQIQKLKRARNESRWPSDEREDDE